MKEGLLKAKTTKAFFVLPRLGSQGAFNVLECLHERVSEVKSVLSLLLTSLLLSSSHLPTSFPTVGPDFVFLLCYYKCTFGGSG